MSLEDIKIYTIPELTEILRLTPQSVRKQLKEGKLKGRKVGTKWLVTEDAVIEYLRGE